MRVFVLSVMFYLIGVIAVLYLKPRLMFTSEGHWKEFGIGSEHRTPFPFWAFVVSYAFFSFLAAKLLIRPETIIAANIAMATGTGHDEASVLEAARPKTAVPPKKKKPAPPSPPSSPDSSDSEDELKRGQSVPLTSDMKPGYYKLNTKRSKKGVPRYIYLGAEAPGSDSEGEA